MQISVISHFFNEEILIGDWVKHHSKFFDHGILINHHSTDNSVEIARSVLPDGWKIVDSRLQDFNAINNDIEVMDWEQTLPGWKMALNTTEFLFMPNFRESLAEWEEKFPDVMAFGSRALCLVDDEEKPIVSPVWLNRTFGFADYENNIADYRKWRFVHKNKHGYYTPGRHNVDMPKMCIMEFLHLHFLFSPWPACKDRKLQIQTRIPESDKRQGFGVQHLINEQQLEQKRNEHLRHSFNLTNHPLYSQYKLLMLSTFPQD